MTYPNWTEQYEDLEEKPGDGLRISNLDIVWDWFKKWAQPLSVVMVWVIVIYTAQVKPIIK